MPKIGILIVDDNEANQTALRQVLDSEDWYIRVPPVAQALSELSSGEWPLVIANIATLGFASPVYLILKELAQAPAMEEGKMRARVLFVVPENAPTETVPQLEREHLPYVLKPFQFHDLLEKVSDLLMETDSLANPIRRVRHDTTASERKRQETRLGRESRRQYRRDTTMFAKRDEYVMTEEEIAEYEKSEKEELDRKKKKNLLQDRY